MECNLRHPINDSGCHKLHKKIKKTSLFCLTLNAFAFNLYSELNKQQEETT